MKSFLLSLILIGLPSLSDLNAQNPSFEIVFDSIYPLIEKGNYLQAKQLWIDTEKDYPMNQQEKLFFLLNSLRNDDISYFKKEMKSLIKNSGYHLTIIDTSLENSDYMCNLYREKGILDWVVSKSSKMYPKWITKNPTSYYVQQRCDFFSYRDKYIISNPIPLCDSSENCLDGFNEYYERLAMTEASEIASLFIELDNIPNNIDHGVGGYYPLLTVIHHIIESSENVMDYSWSLWFPHIAKARLAGKIGTDLFYLYDEACYFHTGFQYFGLYRDVPVKDEAGLKERQTKYGLK